MDLSYKIFISRMIFLVNNFRHIFFINLMENIGVSFFFEFLFFVFTSLSNGLASDKPFGVHDLQIKDYFVTSLIWSNYILVLLWLRRQDVRKFFYHVIKEKVFANHIGYQLTSASQKLQKKPVLYDGNLVKSITALPKLNRYIFTKVCTFFTYVNLSNMQSELMKTTRQLDEC